MNEGVLKISINDDRVRGEISRRFEEIGSHHIYSSFNHIHITYDTWKQLQRYTCIIQSILSDEQLDKCKGMLVGKNQDPIYQMEEYPFSQLSLIIKNPIFVKIIQEQLFQSFMQPIIATKDQQVIGYEFLLRPNSKIYTFHPGELFLFAQHTGLQSMLDSQARITSIKTASHFLPTGMKQFINFLPSSIYDPQHCLNTTFAAVKEYGVDPQDLIFEVVETEKIKEVSHLKNIFDTYQKAGMKIALDDIGSGYATIELLKELKPDYAKIDRELIQNCHQSAAKLEKIKQLSEITKAMGTILLAEGIETIEEFNAIKPLVDLAQGYYFGKPIKNPA
ncbi:EAL domain-containing protein [Salipaludibacillus sp. HK11]|uniref:EAL domain-containing protein n=1 Tax=Salipaludibacillus sp. HK11 TaxID=3394320 RepID=UPI0039FCD3BE